MIRTWMRWAALVGVCVLLQTGCVSVPAEAPELSAELGKRITAIEEAHLSLLHQHFDLKRSEVDRFMETEWAPTFLDKFFKKEDMAAKWDIVVREDDAEQRQRFLTEVGSRANAKINEVRLELHAPLDLAERQVERALRNEYAQVRTMNQTITSLLMSAAKIDETRTSYLQKIGADEGRISSVIAKIDSTLSGVLGAARRGEELVDQASTFRDDVEGILAELSDTADNLGF